MDQYDPTVIRAGLAGVLGADTLRADKIAEAGLTTAGLAAGDACQVSADLTLVKAVNTSTSHIVGVYDGVSGSVVRAGVVVATMAAGVVLANGDTVYLSATSGALTNIKPTRDMLHEVGVVVDGASSKILLQSKPVIALLPTPPPSVWVMRDGNALTSEYSAPAGVLLGQVDLATGNHEGGCFDGTYLWTWNQNNPARIEKYNALTRLRVGGWTFGYPLDGGSGWAGKIAFDGVNYWVLAPDSRYLIKFDANGTVLATLWISGADAWKGVAYDGVGSIITNGTYNVCKVNATTHAIAGPLAMGWQTNATGCIKGGYFYLFGQVVESWPQRVFVKQVRISDLTITGSWDTGYRSNDNSFGNCVTDGTYVYSLIYSNGRMLKTRISDGADMLGVVAPAAMSCIATDGTWIYGVGGGQLRKVNPADFTYVNLVASSGALSVITNKVLPYP